MHTDRLIFWLTQRGPRAVCLIDHCILSSTIGSALAQTRPYSTWGLSCMLKLSHPSEVRSYLFVRSLSVHLCPHLPICSRWESHHMPAVFVMTPRIFFASVGSGILICRTGPVFWQIVNGIDGRAFFSFSTALPPQNWVQLILMWYFDCFKDPHTTLIKPTHLSSNCWIIPKNFLSKVVGVLSHISRLVLSTYKIAAKTNTFIDTGDT